MLIESALTIEVVCDEVTDDVLIIQGAVWEDTYANVETIRGRRISKQAI
jgi:hypothetical protein